MTWKTIAVALACSVAFAAPAHADWKDDAKTTAGDIKDGAKEAAGSIKDGAKAAANAIVSYTEDPDKAVKMTVTALGIAGDITIATGNRVRRSIAFGPHGGAYVGTSLGANSQLVTGVTFGMAIYRFDVPSILDIDKLLQAQVETIVKAEAARIASEGGMPDLEAIARTAYANLKEDIMGKIRPKTLEKPKLALVIEGLAQFEPGPAMGARGTISYGIGPIALGLGGGFTRGSSNTIGYAGAELGLRLTPWGKSWTPVMDLYLRVDGAFDDSGRDYVMSVGGRMLLDLI